MKHKIKIFLRDIVLLILLLVLLGSLVKRTSRFVSVHKHSLIHELDNEILQQLETIKRCCVQIKNLFKHKIDGKEMDELELLYNKLTGLEVNYKKNSHVLAFLGPIGTISIVLKERQVKYDLFQLTQSLLTFVDRYNPLETKEIASIEEGIAIFQKLGII